MCNPLTSRRSLCAAAIVALGAMICNSTTHAGVRYEIRAATTQTGGATFVDSTHATVTAAGQWVDLEVYAIISGSDGTQTNDGFGRGDGSMISTANGANPRLLGDLRGGTGINTTTTVNNVVGFNFSPAATSGFQTDSDGDGDLDDGTLGNFGAAAGVNEFFLAVTDANLTPLLGTNSGSGAPLEELIGTNVFTVGAGAAGQSTLVDFIPRDRTIGVGPTQLTIRWRQDGVDLSARGDNTLISHAGTIVTMTPEPASLALLTLGGLLLMNRPRRRDGRL